MRLKIFSMKVDEKGSKGKIQNKINDWLRYRDQHSPIVIAYITQSETTDDKDFYSGTISIWYTEAKKVKNEEPKKV